jgi:hypothetical protein
MKKTILASLTVAAALVASAPLAKANAFLELISGATTTTATLTTIANFSGITVGSWNVDVEASGSGFYAPNLIVNLNTSAIGGPTAGLTAIFSSGTGTTGYNVYAGTGIFGLSSSGSTVAVAGQLFSSSALYTGSGSEGTQFLATLNLAASSSNTAINESGAVAANPAEFFTEQLDFGGGSGAVLGGGNQSVQGQASFTVVPDGGLTMAMLGSSLVLLAGIRSKLSKKS